MTTPEQCPEASQWRSFLDGETDARDAVQLESHLELCEACQQTLERLAAGRETWEGTAEQLAAAQEQADQLESSGHLKNVIDDLKLGVEPDSETAAVTPESLTFLVPAEDDGVLGRIGQYDVLEIIGHGGMGVVLKAWEPSLRRVVAIKVLASHLANSAAARKRFVREAQAAAAVTHDHVVAIHAVEADHEPPYLMMHYIEGKTLQQRLDLTGPLDVREILRIGQQTALGLAAAHRQGIVHRDIKPANILLENGVERVRITDFGLARAVDDASMTQSGVVAGTPLFMAPEQAQGLPVDHRSDLFSLGSVLYAMCTGRPPFRSSTMMGVIRRVCDESPRPIREINPDIPEWLCAIIDRLLVKQPEQRLDSAEEVAELLAGCLAHVQRPLTVPLPNFVQNLSAATAERRTAITESAPTETRHVQATSHTQPRPDSRTTAVISEYTRRAVRWPARLMVATAILNSLALTATLVLLLSYAPPGPSPESGPLALIFPALLMVEILVVVGALRMRHLQSRRLSLVAAALCVLVGPAYPLGWLAGIWALIVLGREDVQEAFAANTSDGSEVANELLTPSSTASPGRVVARVLAIFIVLFLSIMGPIAVYLAAGPVDPDFLLFMFAGVVFLCVGLGPLFRYGYGTNRGQSGAEQVRLWKAGMQSPGNWIGTMLSVFALGTMMIDITGPFYQPWTEAAVLPLAGVTLLTLALIAMIRGIRSSRPRQSTSDYGRRHPMSWPAGMAVLVLPAALMWWQWSQSQGYVHFVTDSNDTLIRLYRTGTKDMGPSYGRVSTFRVTAGNYHWSVSEYGLSGDRVDRGVVVVHAGRTSELPVRILGEELKNRLTGRWKCSEYEIDWSAGSRSAQPMVAREETEDTEPESTGLPAWTRRPIWMEIENRVLVFHYDESPYELSYGLTVDAKRSPKRLFLVPNPHSQELRKPQHIVQGIWTVGQNSLVMRLEPSDRDLISHFHSRRTESTHIQVEFRKPDDNVRIQGQWELSSAEQDGSPSPEFDTSGVHMHVDRSRLTISSNMDRGPSPVPRHLLLREGRHVVALESDADPPRFTFQRPGEDAPSLFGLYGFSQDTVTMCVSGEGCPHAMTSVGDGSGDVVVFRRIPLQPPVWEDQASPAVE